MVGRIVCYSFAGFYWLAGRWGLVRRVLFVLSRVFYAELVGRVKGRRGVRIGISFLAFGYGFSSRRGY